MPTLLQLEDDLRRHLGPDEEGVYWSHPSLLRDARIDIHRRMFDATHRFVGTKLAIWSYKTMDALRFAPAEEGSPYLFFHLTSRGLQEPSYSARPIRLLPRPPEMPTPDEHAAALPLLGDDTSADDTVDFGEPVGSLSSEGWIPLGPTLDSANFRKARHVSATER